MLLEQAREAGFTSTPSIHAGHYVFWTTDKAKAERLRGVEHFRVIAHRGSKFSEPVPGFEVSFPVESTEAELSAEGTGS